MISEQFKHPFWIDNKGSYDTVPQKWLIECTVTLPAALNVRQLLSNSIHGLNGKVELTLGGERLGDVNIRRGICQGDSFSAVASVTTPIPLSIILRKVNIKKRRMRQATTIIVNFILSIFLIIFDNSRRLNGG